MVRYILQNMGARLRAKCENEKLQFSSNTVPWVPRKWQVGVCNGVCVMVCGLVCVMATEGSSESAVRAHGGEERKSSLNTYTLNPIGNCFSVPKFSVHLTGPFALIPKILST